MGKWYEEELEEELERGRRGPGARGFGAGANPRRRATARRRATERSATEHRRATGRRAPARAVRCPRRAALGQARRTRGRTSSPPRARPRRVVGRRCSERSRPRGHPRTGVGRDSTDGGATVTGLSRVGGTGSTGRWRGRSRRSGPIGDPRISPPQSRNPPSPSRPVRRPSSRPSPLRSRSAAQEPSPEPAAAQEPEPEPEPSGDGAAPEGAEPQGEYEYRARHGNVSVAMSAGIGGRSRTSR